MSLLPNLINNTLTVVGNSLQFLGSGLNLGGYSIVSSSTPPSAGFVLTTNSNGTASFQSSTGVNSLLPQNIQSANYTTVLGDSGYEIYVPVSTSAAISITIPANASVAYSLGTNITFTNMSLYTVTISINSDTLYLAGTGSTGSRTLQPYGTATACKKTTTSWLIGGIGLT